MGIQRTKIWIELLGKARIRAERGWPPGGSDTSFPDGGGAPLASARFTHAPGVLPRGVSPLGLRCPLTAGQWAHLVLKWPERRANCHSGSPTQPSGAFDSPRRTLLRDPSVWRAPARFAHAAASSRLPLTRLRTATPGRPPVIRIPGTFPVCATGGGVAGATKLVWKLGTKFTWRIDPHQLADCQTRFAV
jgi:hypothetical protein